MESNMTKKVSQIKQELSQAETAKGEEKLQIHRKALADLKDIEQAAARDFSYDLWEIQEMKELLPKVITVIHRLSKSGSGARMI
jgi:hypothetical protein